MDTDTVRIGRLLANLMSASAPVANPVSRSLNGTALIASCWNLIYLTCRASKHWSIWFPGFTNLRSW
jgi:hypothetical protein